MEISKEMELLQFYYDESDLSYLTQVFTQPETLFDNMWTNCFIISLGVHVDIMYQKAKARCLSLFYATSKLSTAT